MDEFDALLVVERGPVPAAHIPLQSEQLTIGRSAGNDLALADPEVSRRHARVIRRADGFAVEDAGSTNGTFVNGQRISHLTLLQDGDTIDLGDTVRLRFISSQAAPTPANTDLSDRPTQALAPAAVQALAPAQWSPSANPAPAAKPAYAPSPPQPPSPTYQPPPAFAAEAPRRGRGLLIGCGLLLALLLVCAGTFLVLDAYDQGRLLYCGPFAVFFEVILGPFGFAPACL